jgi:hypothetical protein
MTVLLTVLSRAFSIQQTRGRPGYAKGACSICRGYRKALLQIQMLPMNGGSSDQAK